MAALRGPEGGHASRTLLHPAAADVPGHGTAIAYAISICGMYGVFARLAHRELTLLKAYRESSKTPPR
jgi:hypothetical protein